MFAWIVLEEDDNKLSIKHQIRLNPNTKEVVKEELLKLLKANIVYHIFDSKWVRLSMLCLRKGVGSYEK